MQGATKAAAAAGSNLQAAAKKVQQKAAAAAAAATAAIAAAEPAPSPPAAAGPKGTLIVCPLSVLSNWQTQIEEHTAGNLQVRIVCVLLLSYLT
jgi:SWI/SNF-related matrix-associated actin-dependent regulator of chromatin subfamily A3